MISAENKENQEVFSVPENLMKSEYLKTVVKQDVPFGYTDAHFPATGGEPEVRFKEIWFKNEIYRPVMANVEEKPLEDHLF